MADQTPVWSRKRKSVERGDMKGVLGPSKKFQSPLIITARSGKTSTKTKSRIDLVDGNGNLDEDHIKQQCLARISEVEVLLKQKRGASQESILSSLCKTTPRTMNNPSTTTPNPFSFMTPGRRRQSVAGRRESGIGRRDSVYGRRSAASVRKEILSGKTPGKPRFPMSARKMKLRASLQLKMLESQELQASRLAQVKWEAWMDNQERAYGGLLNEILRQPMDPNVKVMEIKHSMGSLERSSGHGVGIRSFDNNCSHLKISGRNFSGDDRNPIPSGQQNRRTVFKAQTSALRSSTEMKDNIENDCHAAGACLNQICSIVELKRRLVPYLENAKCDRIISTMTQLAKYIDDGRLRMKPNCIVLSDVALRTKALGVLFSYNPVWLRLGLAIVLGPIAFSNKNTSTQNVTEHEGENHPQNTFLEVLIEEHFFGDSSLAKQFSTNRSIGGLYRDGYKEALGKVILKRMFLLVLVLDKIKSETALDVQNGIDGLDGGSPLLFEPNGCVKSSRQSLEDFLSHVMQGEGDLIVHVGKLGYHVSHIQAPLSEYDFEVRNVVEDLQDGIRLCRLAQLMSHDLSILRKVKFPCQAPKKRTYNCELALQSLTQSGVLLEDETGATITAEHIASGQREKTLSLIWNLILHLQVPRLVSHPMLFQELERVGLVANPDANGYAVLDLLLSWVQAICANAEGVTVQNFSTSFADGQVLCHLISNFLPQCLPRHAIKIPETCASNREEGNQNEQWELRSSLNNEISMCKDRAAVVHNFQMVERVAELLGIAPEVLRLSDMVDEDPCTSERNIIIFVAHLCSALLNADPQCFQATSSVAQRYSMDKSNVCREKCSELVGVDLVASCSSKQDWASENAATCIQAWYKGRRQRLQFKDTKVKVIELQRYVRAWLIRERTLKGKTFSMTEEDDDSVVVLGDESEAMQQENFLRHVLTLQLRVRNRMLRVAFLSQRQAARTIQQYWHNYQIRRKESRKAAAVVIQSFWRGHLIRNLLNQRHMAALTIQKHFRGYIQLALIRKRNAAALCIQKHVRGFFQISEYRSRLTGVKRLQALLRGALVRLQARRDSNNITKVQAVWRGCCTRRLVNRWRAAAFVIQLQFRGYMHRSHFKTLRSRIVQLQAVFRGALVRKKLRLIRQASEHILVGWRRYRMRRILKEKHAAAVTIQSRYRCVRQRKWFQSQQSRVILLQAIVRGRLARKKFRDMRAAAIKIQSRYRVCLTRKRMKVENSAAIQIQRHFRTHLQSLRNQLQYQQHAAITIQSSYRSYVQRKLYYNDRQAIITIQSIWRGYVQRKDFKNVTKDAASNQAIIAAACVIQSQWRRYLARKKHVIDVSQRCIEQFKGGCSEMQQGIGRWEYNHNQFKAAHILTLWAKGLILRCRFLALRRAVITIQKIFRGHKARQGFQLIIVSVCRIQAHWRGHKWRSGQSRMKQHMQELRLRMQSTAATVDNSQRLGNRLTDALAQLLNLKTVSGILNTCATIDMATEHSKHCCERLAEGGAVIKLLMLIQTVNRSPPHEQVLKHALSILANLARFPNLASSIAGEAESLNIIVEQLLIFRNKEEVFSKAMKILLHVCRTPGCVDIIQQDALVVRRLHNVSDLLVRRFEVEKRNLEKLPPSAPSSVRKAADRKMRETVQQKQSIMSIMPGLVAQHLNQRPAPPAPTVRLDSLNVNKVPLVKPSEERKLENRAPSISTHTKTSIDVAKLGTAILRSKSIPNKKTTSQRTFNAVPVQTIGSVPLFGDRKRYEGAVKDAISGPNSGCNGREERVSSNPSIKIRAKPVCASSGLRTSQNGLPRVPLKDRSNNATKTGRR